MLVVTIEFGTTYGDILCGCDAAVVCVPTCCHRRSFVCASCAGVSPDMCANNLEAVTLMFASLSVHVLIPRRRQLGSDLR
jgi:hypothetical protein